MRLIFFVLLLQIYLLIFQIQKMVNKLNSSKDEIKLMKFFCRLISLSDIILLCEKNREKESMRDKPFHFQKERTKEDKNRDKLFTIQSQLPDPPNHNISKKQNHFIFFIQLQKYYFPCKQSF